MPSMWTMQNTEFDCSKNTAIDCPGCIYLDIAFAMTSFLDIRYAYDASVIRTIYYYLDANTFGMVPTWNYGILRGYCNCYLIIMCTCL